MKYITIRRDIFFENIGPKSARRLKKKFLLHLYGRNYWTLLQLPDGPFVIRNSPITPIGITSYD